MRFKQRTVLTKRARVSVVLFFIDFGSARITKLLLYDSEEKGNIMLLASSAKHTR